LELFDSPLIALGYLLLAKSVLLLPRALPRDMLFAILNISAVGYLFSWGQSYWLLGSYVLLVLLQYTLTTRRLLRVGSGWIAIVFPVLVLLSLKYLPDQTYKALGLSSAGGVGPVFLGMVGLSYMAFRLSYASVEIRNGVADRPNAFQYLSYAFFLPTLFVGPISRLSAFLDSYGGPKEPQQPWLDSLVRLSVGAVKFVFLANVFSQFTFDSLLMDGSTHHWYELVVACVGYYLFLYFNFSGFCDVAIGLAGLLGIRVDENFDNPFKSRNVQDFWNRWHITLNRYMRDIVFTPMSKSLVRLVGARYLNYVVAFSLFVIFILIGIWHGRQEQFLYFGLIHAFAVSVTHGYGVLLKRRLGPAGYKRYMSNGLITASARVLTFTYVSLSFLVFANSPERIERIFSVLYF
jgi:D-alanyl-lipoteichoic acid acyltransferase DltB (MBOAT superfamily)